MRTLNLKLLRDFRRSWSLVIAILLVMSLGIGSYVGMGRIRTILTRSQSAYYRAYHFADFWVDLKKAPLAAVERLAAWPGVGRIECRVVEDVMLDVPGVEEAITGRLISTPEKGWDSALNGLCLLEGSGFSPDRDEEVILAAPFARAHGLKPGDRVNVILNRKQETFLVVGTAISPEYVYMVRGEGDILPDAAHFGVLFVKESFAREAFDFKDSCNQVCGSLAPDFEGPIQPLLDRLSRELDDFGVVSAIPRERQPSHQFLSSEIQSVSVTSFVFPALFLGFSSLILSVLMGRLVERQRTVIGTLKALGYSDRRLALHFAAFAVLVGLTSAAIGLVVGQALVSTLLMFYRIYFQFPEFVQAPVPGLYAMAFILAVVFSLIGARRGAWTVLRLAPAEAMRPRPPIKGGAVFLERRFPAFWRRLSFRTHMALRSLLRNRTRTIIALSANTMGFALLLIEFMMIDAIGHILDFQFSQVSLSDTELSLKTEAGPEVIDEMMRWEGVSLAEPILGVAADLRNGPRVHRMAIIGLSAGHALMVPRDARERPIQLPPTGLVMSVSLADKLGVGPGDWIDVTPVNRPHRTYPLRLRGIAESYFGLTCYADLEYLSRVLDESWAANGVQLAVEEGARVDRRTKEVPNIAAMTVRNNMRIIIDKLLLENLSVSVTILLIFAGGLSLGAMVNGSLVELSERQTDVATLRVMGYTAWQTAGIFFLQNAVAFIIGLALAFPLGYFLVTQLVKAYDAELLRMPVVLTQQTLFLTPTVALAFFLVGQAIIYHQVKRLNWREALMVKE